VGEKNLARGEKITQTEEKREREGTGWWGRFY